MTKHGQTRCFFIRNYFTMQSLPNQSNVSRFRVRKSICSSFTGDHENRVTDYTSVILEHTAFAQNTRDEVRDLKGRAGALAASPGMKQQTYIIEKIVLNDQGGKQISVHTDGKAPTIRAEMHGNVPCVVRPMMISGSLKPAGGEHNE